MNRNIILSFFVLIFFVSSAQNSEVEISSNYKKMLNFKEAIDSNRNLNNIELTVSYQDSLIEINKRLINNFKSLSIKDDLKNITNDTDINVVSSKDKKVTVFSWNSFLGGTMEQYINILLYKSDNKLAIILINSGDIFPSENYKNIYVEGIFIRNSYSFGKTYLIYGVGKCGNFCETKSLFLYSINKIGELYENKRILRTRDDKTRENISVSYDLDSDSVDELIKFRIKKKEIILTKGRGFFDKYFIE